MENENYSLFSQLSFGGSNKKKKKRDSKNGRGTTRGSTDYMKPSVTWNENTGKGAMSGGGTAGGSAPGSDDPRVVGGDISSDIPH